MKKIIFIALALVIISVTRLDAQTPKRPPPPPPPSKVIKSIGNGTKKAFHQVKYRLKHHPHPPHHPHPKLPAHPKLPPHPPLPKHP